MSAVSHRERNDLRVLGVVCTILAALSLSSCASMHIPSVVGLSLPRAVKALEEAGFRQITALDGRGLTISQSSYADGYTVTAQDPNGSKNTDPSTSVTLTATKDPAPTPSPTRTAPSARTTPTPIPTQTPPRPSPTPPPAPAAPPAAPIPQETTEARESTPARDSGGTYYKNCTEARRAGAAPIYRGEPGYRSQLDRDNDGVACE